MSIRIIGLDEVSTIQSGDYIAIDSETGGTKKFDATKVGYIIGQDIAADYNPSSQYVEGEFCMYDGLLYKCITNITTPEAWNAGHWVQVTVGTALYDKVDKVSGKGLSANDFTDALKTKLDDIEAGAEVNVQADWAETDDTKDDFIKNKPTIDTALSDSSTNAVENRVITDAINDLDEKKANINGAYDELYAGTAGQLASNVTINDKVPYNFRTSGGSVDIGDRKTEEIVGGTYAWNQLIPVNALSNVSGEGYSIINNGDGSYTVNGTFPGQKSTSLYELNVKSGDVILIRSLGNASLQYRENSVTIDNIYNSDYIYRVSNLPAGIRLTAYAGTYDNDKATPTVYNLTAMFGSTIADKIYAMEQLEAGTGVAWFKKLFPKPYYAYDAGSLQSVNTSASVMTGFNQWDEEWEVGDINSAGEPVVANDRIRSKNYIPATPSTTYYFCAPHNIRVLEYDGSKNFIKRTDGLIQNVTLTLSEDTHYLKFYTNPSYGTTYHNDICINLHWDGERDGEYEPYEAHSYDLDSSLQLRGLPKLDELDRLYYDGDVYSDDGTVTRKYGIVDLGTLTWTYDSTYQFFYVIASQIQNKKSGQNITCSKYTVWEYPSWTGDSEMANCPNKSICSNGRSGGYIYIKDSSYTDAATFKTAMSGVYLVYELATPTTEQATGYTNPMIVNDWGTETFVDYAESQGTRDVAIPVGHNTEYLADLKAKLEMAPDSPDGDGKYIVQQLDGENYYVSFNPDTKANIDGYYEDMTVGNAEQLVSDVYEEDQVPYNFRTSGGSIDIGDREYDEVVGGTVAWNQLVQDGDFPNSTNKWSTMSGSTTTISNNQITVSKSNVTSGYIEFYIKEGYRPNCYANHRHLVVATVQSNNKVRVFPDSATGINYETYATKTNVAFIWTPAGNGILTMQFRCFTGVGVTADLSVTCSNVMVFDLTAMFGSTIADYIYTLETNTPGAGVAWFKKLFPKPYYAYNAGALQSVQTNEHKMTGFNQFDKTKATIGAYRSAGGGDIVSAGYAHTDYIPALPNTTYYVNNTAASSTVTLFLNYDADKQYIGSSSSQGSVNLRSTLENTRYVIVNATKDEIDSLCINLAWDNSRNGEYEPYVEYSYPLDPDLELRGIPKLDANNQLYYDGDTYEADGTVTRRFNIVDLSSLEWSTRATGTVNKVISSYLPTQADWYNPQNVIGLCESYLVVGKNSGTQLVADVNTADVGFYFYNSGTAENVIYLVIPNNSTPTGELVYLLATPTTETADPFQSPQIVNDFGTEEYVDAGVTASTPTRDVAIPVGHNTRYTANLKAKVEMSPDSPSSAGDYFVRQADGENAYVDLASANVITAINAKLPTPPSEDGSYRLTVTVASGVATYSWVSAT